MSSMLKVGILSLKSGGTETLVSDELTIDDNGFFVVAAESSTTDDLSTITYSVSGVTSGFVILRADSGDTITVKHGVDNISLNAGEDFDLTGDITLMLFWNGTVWADLGAGSGSVDWANPGTIGSGTPNTAVFTTLQVNSWQALSGWLTLNAGAFMYVNDAAGTFVKDSNANEMLVYARTASAVNHLKFSNAATTNPPILESAGDDTNIGLRLLGKGTGFVEADGLRLYITSELTISAGGEITITDAGRYTVDTNGDAASDDLDTISGGADGKLLIISPEHTDRTIVVKHGTGNIYTLSESDITLDSTEKALVLVYLDAISGWLVLGDGVGAGGGAPTDATYITQTANGTLTNEQALSSLATGEMDVTNGTGVVTSRKHNLAAGGAPTVNDDDTADYSVGSLWIDTTNDNVYRAVDVTTGAAIWRQLDVTAHADLTGLVAPADDHTQYLLADGTRGLSADWDAGSHKITAEQLESDVATGTAPLVVASTTLVSNLNADQLDGAEGDAYGHVAGDVYTGTHDFGGADDLEIPNSAAPVVDTAGQIAIDTTVTDHDGLMTYYDGSNAMFIIAIHAADLTTNDGDIISYDAANNKFTMGPPSAGTALPTGLGPLAWSAATAPSGWMLCDGSTMGDASSGADFTGTDYEDLFAHLWDNYANTELVIQDSSGTPTTRGANAAADWAAHKRMPVLDMRGNVPVGKDNMGGSSANRITAAEADTLGDMFGVEYQDTPTQLVNAGAAYNVIKSPVSVVQPSITSTYIIKL